MIVLVMAHNRRDVLADALASVLAATERAPIWVLDNGSQQDMRGLGVPIVKLLDNIGNYRGFVEALHFAEAMNQEIVAVLHSDFYIWERGWDRRVEEAFSGDPLLGLVGFAASHQVDGSGGRGLGTVTNYQGRAPRWSSKAEVHGRRFTGFMAAAQVDGCSMVFRTETLRSIGLRSDFPPITGMTG